MVVRVLAFSIKPYVRLVSPRLRLRCMRCAHGITIISIACQAVKSVIYYAAGPPGTPQKLR